MLTVRLCVHEVDIPPSQVHILDGNAADLHGECAAYEALIRSVGGIELFLGGIGEDGHIAFNEPGVWFLLKNCDQVGLTKSEIRQFPQVAHAHQDAGIRYNPGQCALLQ